MKDFNEFTWKYFHKILIRYTQTRIQLLVYGHKSSGVSVFAVTHPKQQWSRLNTIPIRCLVSTRIIYHKSKIFMRFIFLMKKRLLKYIIL